MTYSPSYTHDTLGRIATNKQVTGNDPAYMFSYPYSLSDRLSQIQYPSGRSVNYLPDSAGQIQKVQNGGSGVNYERLSYTAPGDVCGRCRFRREVS